MAELRGPFITPRGSVDTKILFKIGPLARKMNIYFRKLMFLKTKCLYYKKTVLMTRHFTFF